MSPLGEDSAKGTKTEKGREEKSEDILIQASGFAESGELPVQRKLFEVNLRGFGERRRGGSHGLLGRG